MLFFLFSSPSYLEIDSLAVWALACVVLIFIARENIRFLSHTQRISITLFGVFLCFFSFINIPLGFGNPPYSIGDFSLFLSGLGIIIFGVLGLRSFILPVSIPCATVIGFQLYDHTLRHQEWISAPLIPPIVAVNTLLLNLVGIPARSSNDVITILSRSGTPVSLVIGGDCTGIWSLGTFTACVIVMLVAFPRLISREGGFLVLSGYIGTFIFNYMRIFFIFVSGYLYGPVGVIQTAHIHIGWIAFSLWMFVFWYYVLTRFLRITLRRNTQDGQSSKDENR